MKLVHFLPICRSDNDIVRCLDGDLGKRVVPEEKRWRNLEHIFRWALHNPSHGIFLHLHWHHLQRRFLQVGQYLWFELECILVQWAWPDHKWDDDSRPGDCPVQPGALSFGNGPGLGIGQEQNHIFEFVQDEIVHYFRSCSHDVWRVRQCRQHCVSLLEISRLF